MEYLYEYLSFVAKAGTVVVGIVLTFLLISGLSTRRSGAPVGHLQVHAMNDRLREMRRSLDHALLTPAEFKKLVKRDRKADKHRGEKDGERQRVYVLAFDGDVAATAVDRLRHEVTALLTIAEPRDEVVVRIESAGGLVHGYGLAASELARVKQKGISLTATVDKIAASGGYLMASVAHRIIAAPFALVGSIGVIAQLPNVNRLLKKHDVDWEILTAGQYKRTLTIFGENTDQGRQKLREELEDVHALFQEFVGENRPSVDLSGIATGEAWYGRRALDRKLVDELSTSEDYLVRACDRAEVFEVKWVEPKKPIERLLSAFQTLFRIGAWKR
jgi:serine protease SohB